MSDGRKYNSDALFYFPLIADGAQDFVNDYTPAAGDIKVFTDKLISTNPTCLILGFDSLSELPAQGATIDENGVGTASGVVAFTVITSGTVGGGDAAGFFFLRSKSGDAWTNNDQIDINGGTENIATADSTTYDLAATAGLIADLGNGQYAIALSPTEMSCAQGIITIVDSATKATEDQDILFHTFGNAAALLAMDFDDAVRGGLTALPNAAADAPGGLVISDTGGLDMDLLDAAAVRLTAARAAVLTDWIDEGRLDAILDLITAAGPTKTEMDNAHALLATPAQVATELGTYGANTTTPPTVAEIQAELEENAASLLDTIRDELANGADGLTALKTAIDAIPTTAMRGTENANTTTPPTVAEIQAELEENGSSLLDTIRDELANGTDGLSALLTAINLRTAAGPTKTEMDNAHALLATPAQVLTQVNAALDTAISELSQAQPSATPSLRDATMLLYMALAQRLDTTTSGDDELQIFNAAGTVIAKKALTDASGDYSEARMVSGP